MNREGHEEIKFFTGIEVEHTPAHGMETLFVIGVQPSSEITPRLKAPIKHIYFGANMSFPDLKVNDGAEWAKWENMIYHYLELGYWCTLDVDISCVEGLVESGLPEHHQFIPMISAKVPYLQLLGYNATLKIDDKDFKATNPGVWCHSLNSLTNRSQFTDWSKYTKDEPT